MINDLNLSNNLLEKIVINIVISDIINYAK